MKEHIVHCTKLFRQRNTGRNIARRNLCGQAVTAYTWKVHLSVHKRHTVMSVVQISLALEQLGVWLIRSSRYFPDRPAGADCMHVDLSSDKWFSCQSAKKLKTWYMLPKRKSCRDDRCNELCKMMRYRRYSRTSVGLPHALLFTPADVTSPTSSSAAECSLISV